MVFKMEAKINYPVISEKAVNMIETQNKITFIVTKDATKPEVKKAVEDRYKVKVEKVNILKDMKGRKKAIVKLTKEFKASELASKIGMI
ncbi:MAG: 50S ribosomal protein L23 [Candidatus ainarchaeum sp.]|nr:50S ribosomal protein L23 [Candidatus ainarchaeum sp.]